MPRPQPRPWWECVRLMGVGLLLGAGLMFGALGIAVSMSVVHLSATSPAPPVVESDGGAGETAEDDASPVSGAESVPPTGETPGDGGEQDADDSDGESERRGGADGGNPAVPVDEQQPAVGRQIPRDTSSRSGGGGGQSAQLAETPDGEQRQREKPDSPATPNGGAPASPPTGDPNSAPDPNSGEDGGPLDGRLGDALESGKDIVLWPFFNGQPEEKRPPRPGPSGPPAEPAPTPTPTPTNSSGGELTPQLPAGDMPGSGEEPREGRKARSNEFPRDTRRTTPAKPVPPKVGPKAPPIGSDEEARRP